MYIKPKRGGKPERKNKSRSRTEKTANAKEKAKQAMSSRSIREYMVHSGAAFHIIKRTLLTKEELRTVRKLDYTVRLQTANGAITSSHQAKVHVMELDLTLWAIILKHSPCLISMGKLCRENGFAFKQIGANTPVLQKGRLKVECQTVHDIPFINPSHRTVMFGGDPEDDLFDECFQEEKLALASQSPEPELGETLAGRTTRT